MDLEQTSESMSLIVEEHEKLKTKHVRNYAKKTVSTGAITLKTEPLQESVHIGTYSDAVIEDVVGQMYLIPDFASDNCTRCKSKMNFEFNKLSWSLNLKLISRTFIKSVRGKLVRYILLHVSNS